MSVSVLAHKTCSGIGEGPHWDEKSQSLFYVDISSKEIHKFNTHTSTDVKVNLRKFPIHTGILGVVLSIIICC